MDNRVYYGEYTLKHWIDLMLKKNIVLPQYQRSFVWDDDDIYRLIKDLKESQFVPPVTIARFVCDGDEKNLILDGQQRLTSILLAKLGYAPQKEKFTEISDVARGDDSDGDGDNESIATKKAIKWTFQEMLDSESGKNTCELLLEKLQNDDRYHPIDVNVDNWNDFLENTFLGFSYIVPNSSNAPEIQKYFSTLFRNMNYFGTKLSPLESRRSLYFMNGNLENYFEGKTSKGDSVLCDICIMENMQLHEIDFVRYLSMLTQYKINSKNVNKVLVGYSAYNSRESYYADYVSYIVDQEQENRQDKFNGFSISDVFPNNCWQSRFDTMKTYIESNSLNWELIEKGRQAFGSWINADYWLFGLMFWVLFENKTIDFSPSLVTDIKQEIQNKRADNYYSKVPNRLGNLRDRLNSSIQIYERYVQ